MEMRSGSSVIDRAPPDTDGDTGGGGGGWAWLLTARGVVEAQLVRGVLEASGIEPVALDARDPSPGAWLFLSGNPHALIRIYVPRALLDAARLVMLDIGVQEPEPQTSPAPTVPAWWWVALTALVLLLTVISAFRNAGLS
jgi:hypothetical protein